MAISKGNKQQPYSNVDELRKIVICELMEEKGVPRSQTMRIYNFVRSQPSGRIKNIIANIDPRKPVSLNDFNKLKQDLNSQGIRVAGAALGVVIAVSLLVVAMGSSTWTGSELWKKQIKPKLDQAWGEGNSMVNRLGALTGNKK